MIPGGEFHTIGGWRRKAAIIRVHFPQLTRKPAVSSANLNRRFCIAPMMDWSDRHCRVFWRQLTRQAVLYTEMVTTGALLHAEPARFLDFDDSEHPVALQLGGSNPADLARCAAMAEQWRYDEVNLNCGCPSDRVQNGSFGACLMGEAALVADGVKAMRDATSLPVTVKHRTGIDNLDSYEFLVDFVGTVAEAGCEVFIVHARKAWLSGLSPKQNREIPPLEYDKVYRLKRDFPQLEIIINGGISELGAASEHLNYVDGVMMGRSAYQSPAILCGVDRQFYSAADSCDPYAALENFFPYIESQLGKGTKLNHMTRHILGLFNGRPGAKQFRRHLSENAYKPGADLNVLQDAVNFLGNALNKHQHLPLHSETLQEN
ncbi:MAG: tRNA dihydrouridine(20/20a) synthase DusA [Spongiibacteraceae bacterium]|nr:tRNA dihydrouridine(20/20a) synthase DusA [Spongiibacteraceae bacterium]